MAFFASNTLHEYMPGMSIGIPEGHRALGSFTAVAFLACLPGFHPPVLLLNAGISLDVIAEEEFVSLQGGHPVACLAYDAVMLALFPRAVSLFGQMAEGTKGRVFVYIAVISVPCCCCYGADEE
jgi:hypothetical protein